MRVVLIVRRLMDVGGAQTQLRLLAAELTRRGHRVTILTERVAHIRPPARIDAIPVHPIRSVAVRCLGSLFYAAGLMWYLIARRRTYDVVHVFLLKHSALAAVAAGALARAPVVVRPACAGPFGDIEPLGTRPVWRRVMAVCRYASAFVALSDELIGELSAFGCPRGRIHRIASGMDLPPTVAPPGEAPPTVLFAGRLDAQKGLTGLLHAWRQVADRRPEARLVLLGDGPQRRELAALARSLGVTESVTLAGVVHDVPDRLARSRAFVLPSVGEGMSSALLEAMAAGRAVIATRVSGSVEVIEDGRNGLLVAPNDRDGLAAALGRVLDEPGLADDLGRAAHETIARRYSVERLANDHEDLYHHLLRTGGVRNRRPKGVRNLQGS